MNRDFGAMISRSRHGHAGFSLLLVLILLVVMSLLGIAVLRSSAMQERMGGNLRDRSLAMQGAETALRYVQVQVLGPPVNGVQWYDKALSETLTSDDCSGKGICDASHGTPAPEVWMDLPSGSYDSRLAAAPQYRIEYIGTGPGRLGACNTASDPLPADCLSPMFRVSARSRATGRAEVMLQGIIGSVTAK